MSKKSLRDQLGLDRDLRKTLGLDRSLRELLEIDPNDLPIGVDSTTGDRAYFNLDLFHTHVHVVGRTGTGKTRFLAHIARELIARKMGGCIIDIQGGLYHLMENYVAHHPEFAERVVFFNPGEAQDPIVSFNPLRKHPYIVEEQNIVDMMIEGIMKHMGQLGQAMPTFTYTAGHIFSTLVDTDLTILESEAFIDLVDPTIRKKITAQVSDRFTERFWRNFDREYFRDKKQDMLAFVNRVSKFIRREQLQYTLGRTNHVLDFKELFDQDKFLLVNLRMGPHLSFDAATLMGIFLIHELFNYAMSRPEAEARRHPFILMIDEMQNFITPDIARILDMCRQHGLHLVLAHQRLQQLKNESPDLYSAVMDNAPTKVIFGVSMADAQLLVPEVFPLDLQKIKMQLSRTAVLDYKLEYHKVYSETHGTTTTTGSSSSSGTTTMHGDSMTWPMPYAVGGAQQVSDARGLMDSYGDMDATSNVSMHTEGEVPMLMPILGQELSSVTPYALEELQYLEARGLKDQPVAYATIGRMFGKPQSVALQAVHEWPYDEQKVREALAISVRANPAYYLSKVETIQQIEERQRVLGLIEAPKEQIEIVGSREEKPQSDAVDEWIDTAFKPESAASSHPQPRPKKAGTRKRKTKES